MTVWLDSEKARKEEEDRQEKELFAAKCKKAREEMEQSALEAQRRKKAEQEESRRIAVEQVKAMDKNEADKGAALKARMDTIERNCKTLGEEIAKRDAKMEADLQNEIRRRQEESDRLAREDAERRRGDQKRRVDQMLQKLGEQVTERKERSLIDQEASTKQAAIWRQQYEEQVQKDTEKQAARRQARADLDAALIEQIRENVAIHPKNYGMTSSTQQVDLAYNRVLFEQMASEGFRDDVTHKLLEKARHSGKRDPFPSVGRFDGPIHELEE